LGRQPTLGDLIRLDPPPAELAALKRYVGELGVQSTNSPPAFREVMFRGKRVGVPKGEPTPHDIERLAAEIRAGWSEGEMRVRAGKDRGDVTTWEPPLCIGPEVDQ